MKILFLEGDMSRRGGTERMTAWLASVLCSSHEVHILSLNLHAGEVFFSLAEQVRHAAVHPGKTWAKIKEIRRYIKENGIETVINVDTGMGYIGIFAAMGTKASVITWEHSNYYNNWNSHVFPYLRRFAARHSGAMVVLTEQDKRNYTENIRRCVPVTVIPNPAERHEYTYDTRSKTILSAGLLGKIKRFELIVPIAEKVFAKHPDWIWLLCGDGPERENLENAVQNTGLADKIRLVGSVSDMEAQYRSAAMYVLTSEMEGLPMVLLEAKSYGLPIVSFDIQTGPSDIVRDEVNGYLVESGNTDEMAEKICELIEDAELRKRFSDNAAMDKDKFDEERIMEKWEKLISSL